MPVYNTDRGVPVEGTSDSRLRHMVSATAALIETDKISPDGTMQGEDLGEKYHLCWFDRYYREKQVSFCSGVLVAPALVLTAAHCLKEVPCEKLAVAFDYVQEEVASGARLKHENVFRCEKAVPHKSKDLAFITLDRPAKRRPAEIDHMSIPAKGMRLVTAGHPMGTPLKIQAGAAVVAASEKERAFMTNADNMGGQSGSPVFDAVSGKLVGIMTTSFLPYRKGVGNDFVFDKTRNCYKTRVEEGGQEGHPPKQSVIPWQRDDADRSLAAMSAKPGGTVPYGTLAIMLGPLLKPNADSGFSNPRQVRRNNTTSLLKFD